MVKLYLKKLFFTLLFIFAFPIFGAVCAFVWHLIFRYMLPELVRNIACLILGCLLSFKLLFTFRYEYSAYKRTYIDSFTGDAFSFVKDFKNTFKSKDNLVHTSVFLTIDLIYSVSIAISVNSPFLRFIIVTVIYLLHDGLIFATLNTFVWCLVHKKWMRFLKWRTS